MHLAIVSYTFPPSKEIGGRRWAKFSKEISKRGYEVTVVCTGDSVNNEWYQKEFPHVDFMLLPKKYPHWLTGYTKSFAEKLLYFFSTRLLAPLTKKNLFDRGFVWQRTMLKALENLHGKRPIDVLVVTGAPYSLLYYGSLFKMRHKEILFVGDLRDPWTWGSYYGFSDLALHKKKYQEKQERITLEFCDAMCYTTQHIGDFLKKKYPEFRSKLHLIPHAYDPDKFMNITTSTKRQGFIYGGSLYPGIENYLRRFANILKANPGCGFKWDIYTGTHYPLINSIFETENVKLHPLIPEEQLFQHIANSAAYLVFFPITDKDLISTKFFEIIRTGTPIVYIGEEGEVGRMVRQNNLGIHILPSDMESQLPKYLNGQVPFKDGSFNISQYSFPAVTESFLKLLEPNTNSS